MITIKNKKIRKEKGRNEYRVTIDYITSKGLKRMVSFLCDSRREAENKLFFRLSGLTQGSNSVKIAE